MGRLPLFLLLIVGGLLITIVIRNRMGLQQIQSEVEVWGARLRVSLHEIFSTLSQPGGLGNLAAIRDNTKGVIIWTADVNRPPLNTAYYEIGDYTIFGQTPIRLSLDSLSLFESGTSEKLKIIFKRSVFIGFVDKNGKQMNPTLMILTRAAIILLIVFVLLAVILSIHKTFFGTLNR